MCFSTEIVKDKNLLAKRFKAMIDSAEYAQFELFKQKFPKIFKEPGDDNRIYPNYFNHVLVAENEKRVMKPMRYRVRPAGSTKEIPSKYNVFNARDDSLESRQTWSSLYKRQHGLFAFPRFYEWVSDAGKKRLICFYPKDRDLMWAPCLWDKWTSPDNQYAFYSFALITSEPPSEIEKMGHDRCPIFMDETKIDSWLNPSKANQNDLKSCLHSSEPVTYSYSWA